MLVRLFYVYCFVCTGAGSGQNCAYSLADKMFNRTLLTSFTWTGISIDQSKKAFNVYRNLVRIFFEAVNAADDTFTQIDTESFFQNKLLKYSKSRATKRSRTRSSTARVVPKRRRTDSSSPESMSSGD